MTGADPHDEPAPERFDRIAIGRGAATGVLIAVPASLARRGVDDASSVSSLLFLVVLAGFGVGGAVAATADRAGRPLLQGAMAGLGAAVGYLVLGITIRVATGDAINPASLVFTALLAMSCALIGAEIADRRRRRLAASDDEAPDDPGGNRT